MKQYNLFKSYLVQILALKSDDIIKSVAVIGVEESYSVANSFFDKLDDDNEVIRIEEI